MPYKMFLGAFDLLDKSMVFSHFSAAQLGDVHSFLTLQSLQRPQKAQAMENIYGHADQVGG